MSVYKEVAGTVLMIFLFLAMLYIGPEIPSCEEYTKRLARRQIYIVVTDAVPIGTRFELQGTDPATGKSIEFLDRAAFYIFIEERLSIGDTLEKIRGEQFFTIKKPDCNIKIDFPCKSDPNSSMEIDTISKTSSKLIVISNDSLDWFNN